MKNSLLKIIISSLFSLGVAVSVHAQNDKPMLFRQSAINRTEIAFSFAGDLWIVAKTGGDARRLTTGVGIENNPYFSPDGSLISFTGEYDGNTDVYTVRRRAACRKD